MNHDFAPTPNSEIIVGGVYEHCHHRKYQAQRVILAVLTEVEDDEATGWEWDATGYEGTGKVRKVKVTEVAGFSNQAAQKVVVYTQLEAGSFPAGTSWVRLEEDFKGRITLEDGSVAEIFKLEK